MSVRQGAGRQAGRLTTRRGARASIREFCSLDVPVIMFDKNEDYVVLTLEQVGDGAPAATTLACRPLRD
ncbi:Mitochondrial ornithine carrier protein AmcA/Ort1 [Tolypocladium capitatum]|uniref:Mitochondrial ornithine carrier protein AmcA/Ort1 n=1 Tax=Tolypocladium capitatum TaxID=45235 RepID=A0A2K3PWR0_9HYPO|nr:Mitochondrial ornithine carrier protein AmcA/Ort1 [Tolypocladium capitatum]